MHLSSADKRAAQDGFKFLVLSPSGARKCYCTTVKEAKAEAGKGGKIVSLGRMRYTTQNPGGKKQRARKVRSFGEYVAGQSRGAEELHAGRLLQAARQREKIAELRGMSPHYVEDQTKKLKLYHAQSLKEAARLRKTGVAPLDPKGIGVPNPSARMVGLQRNPWSTAGLNQRHRPVAWIKFYTDAKRNSHAIEVEQYTWGDFQSVINDHNLDGSSYQKQAIADMARLHSGSASELYFRILVDDKHVRELPTLRVSHKERAAALRQAKAMADEYAAREKWKAAAQNPSARMVGLQRNPAERLPVYTRPFNRDTGRYDADSDDYLGDATSAKGAERLAKEYGGRLLKWQFASDKNLTPYTRLGTSGGKKGWIVSVSWHDVPSSAERYPSMERNPGKRRRNPTWTTAAILAGGAYIYGRSAKVREKIKGAIDSAHKKLENPTARMVGMQRNPGFPVSSPPVSKLVKELGITAEEAKHIKALASQGKPKTALKYANDAISRAHGVESLYPEFPHFYYVNMGDTYDTTLYYDGKALRIGDWGSYVERHSR